MQLGGFGGQSTCSQAGADPVIIVSGGGGGSKPDLPFSHPLLTFYRVFKITIPRKQKFPRREPKLFRRCGDRLGV